MWQPSLLALESPVRAGQPHISFRAWAFETHYNPKLFFLEEVGINWLRADDHASMYLDPDRLA